MKTQSKKAQVMEARKQQLEAKKQVLAEKKANRKAMSKANKEMVKDMPKWMKISYGEVYITLEMTENFTNKLMVSGMKRQAFNIIKDLQPLVEANEVRNVTVLFTAMFMDKYGNESQGNAGMFSINASELVKVNFDNVFPEDMENFCTSTYVHPAFKK